MVDTKKDPKNVKSEATELKTAESTSKAAVTKTNEKAPVTLDERINEMENKEIKFPNEKPTNEPAAQKEAAVQSAPPSEATSTPAETRPIEIPEQAESESAVASESHKQLAAFVAGLALGALLVSLVI